MLLMTASVLNGCGEDEVPDVEPELRDHWEAIDLFGFKPNLASSYNIHFAGDSIYLFQVSGGLINHHCRGISGNWRVHGLMTGSPSLTYFVTPDADGSLWMLTDRSLTHIIGCGESVFYSLIDADTLYQPWGVDNHFVSFQVLDGVPWLMHRQWGLFSFDIESETLIHHPIQYPYPYFTVAEIGTYDSMTIEGGGPILIASSEGLLWVFFPMTNWGIPDDPLSNPCRYSGLTVNYQGVPHVYVTCDSGPPRFEQLFGGAVPTLPTLQPPHYFTSSVFDRVGRLAYYGGHPHRQPYIGLQNANGISRTVNAQHAVEEGNVLVHHIGFSPDNTLYAATDRGLFKYLGRDE